MNSPLIGLDFSGAQRPAKQIGLAFGSVVEGKSGERLVLTECRSMGESVLDSPDRSAVYRSLVGELGRAEAAWIGCDFPFSLPEDMLAGQSWESLIEHWDERFTDAEQMRNTCRLVLGGERRRRTDQEAKAPWAPSNWRLYRQTYWGISGVVRPMVLEHGARALPMMSDRANAIKLLEVCPASRLKREGLYRPYKGTEPEHRSERLRISQSISMVARRVFECPARFQEKMVEQPGGDLLDAVIALVIAADARQCDHANLQRIGSYRAEGYIYVG